MQLTPVRVDEPNPGSVEALIRQLVHDLRQPLSTIQNCASYLELVLPEASPAAQAQLRMIERQVEEADSLLLESLPALSRLLLQPAAGADANLELMKSATAAVT
jgi:signal transduction histidine kinase